nr:hypothetical protein 294p2_00056 [Serratia marcescens]
MGARAEADFLAVTPGHGQQVPRTCIQYPVRLAPLKPVFIVFFGDNNLPYLVVFTVPAFGLRGVNALQKIHLHALSLQLQRLPNLTVEDYP